ncbi:Uma2 family endonuclease [Streptomyces iconiensis]|uniref:Uma2 family endonuclease n=1 Tax=Streptomyces iconiensis TaxID=1384038 RepID=A0ABT7A843_9ACTN|nr:Uma2 family endonuclease [Streptomyces iconiensis]MDJ1137498.1 Uma2 family endonuclease [Streptomyces iconiensis]
MTTTETAEPAHCPYCHPGCEWPRPPVGGYTSEDLDRLPGLPSHTQLIDGSLVVASPQDRFHMCMVDALMRALMSQAPARREVIRQMTVTLNSRDRPEPDLILVGAEAVRSMSQTTYRPEDVLLAVEVVSPDSEARDRETKPAKYAAAGIPHFWRVEKDEADRAVVYVFELEPATRKYAVTGIHRDRLKVSTPCPIDIDLTLPTRPAG